MFIRGVILIVLAMLLAAVLLDLRQQRIDAMHDMAVLHREARQSRRRLWELQARIAERVEPDRLREAFARSELKLEPVNPTQPQAHWTPPAVNLWPDERTAVAPMPDRH